MKIYALNISENHPSLEVLGRFGEVSAVSVWPTVAVELTKEPAMIFAKLDDHIELTRITKLCEERGDWCFVWAGNNVLRSIANDVSPALVDFISENYDEQELIIRLVRLVRLERPSGGGNFLGVPDEIADELTKKQLIILKALFEAGEFGLTKSELAQKIWKRIEAKETKATGFNVHILHLRRKLKRFGLMVSYDKDDRLYRLRAAVKARTVKRRVMEGGSLQISQ